MGICLQTRLQMCLQTRQPELILVRILQQFKDIYVREFFKSVKEFFSSLVKSQYSLPVIMCIWWGHHSLGLGDSCYLCKTLTCCNKVITLKAVNDL